MDARVYDAVVNSLSEVMETKGGGMPTGSFLLVAEVLDSDGKHATYLGAPHDQPTHRTLGLIDYAHEVYTCEVRMQLTQHLLSEEEEDD